MSKKIIIISYLLLNILLFEGTAIGVSKYQTQVLPSLQKVEKPHQDHKKNPVTYLTDDGTLIHNGHSFFPIGLYHVGDYALKQLKQNSPEFNWDLDILMQHVKEHGFNTVHTMLIPDKRYIELADRHGLKVISEFKPNLCGGPEELTKLRKSVEQLRNINCIIAWYLIDEPAAKFSKELHKAYKTVKDVDSRPVMVTIHNPAYFKQLSVGLDIFAPDPYPLIEKGDKAISTVTDWLHEANKAASKPIWLVPQCFAADGRWREPTPDELRNMVYQGLVGGAKGIIYYAFTSGEPYTRHGSKFKQWFLPESNLWQSVKELNQEIASLTPVLLSPKCLGNTSVGDSAICFLEKHYNGKTYILAVNIMREKTKAHFDCGVNCSFRVLFEDRAITAANHCFEDTFGPLERHVYMSL
jgi:hypothetical protein